MPGVPATSTDTMARRVKITNTGRDTIEFVRCRNSVASGSDFVQRHSMLRLYWLVILVILVIVFETKVRDKFFAFQVAQGVL
jgi:hypothetical protein